MTSGYINTPVNQSQHIDVGDGHSIYVEECGNPNGIPVIFLHGGPGGLISEKSRRFFNPAKYRIILFDQRGTGQSLPHLSLLNSTVDASVEDIEVIRHHFDVDSWIVFGGSYGSTLALAYAIKYKEFVDRLVLRGIFLGRQSDIDWLFKFGASEFFPQAFAKYQSFIEPAKQDDLVSAYYDMMINGTIDERNQACKHWNEWEGHVIYHTPVAVESSEITNEDLSQGLLESHYFINKMFWNDDNYLLNNVSVLDDIPIDIYHGRYDVDCRLSGAWDLKAVLPHAVLNIVEGAGHSPFEEPMYSELVKIMDEIEV